MTLLAVFAVWWLIGAARLFFGSPYRPECLFDWVCAFIAACLWPIYRSGESNANKPYDAWE